MVGGLHQRPRSNVRMPLSIWIWADVAECASERAFQPDGPRTEVAVACRRRQQLRRPVRIRTVGARAPPWPVLVQPPTTTTARRSRRDRRTRGPEPSATERGPGIKPPGAFDCRGQRPAGRAGPYGQTRGVAWIRVLCCHIPPAAARPQCNAPRVWARDPRAHARPIVRAARPIKGPAPVCTPTWPGSHQIARQRTAAPAGSACVRILRETKRRQRH